ncbi:MAG: VTT domain-containing protein [Asgard group archaeon]|nr:VTT domain-containing protein [Asgard group archaeon]
MNELTSNSDSEMLQDKSELDKQIDDQLEQHEDFELVEKENVFKRIWKWSTKDKSRIGSLIFLFLFMVLIIVLAFYNQSVGDGLNFIVEYFRAKFDLIGIFIGIFIISIFANFTVIFPVPYTFVLVTVAVDTSITALDIFIMGLFAGGGAAIGEVSAYMLGKASKNVIKDGMEKQVSQARKWIDKGYAALIIFIFAATPLPDDAILLFIGLLGYALWKTIVSCFLGKIVLTTATGYAAKYLSTTTFGQKILWLFGLAIDEGGGVSASDPNIWVSAAVWMVTILIIGVVLFIDWGDLWNFLSRSINKRKLTRLVTTDENYTKLNETNSSIEINETKPNKKMKFVKESSLWQISVLDPSKKNETIFHDLYATSYVLEKSSKIMLESNWYQKIMLLVNSEEDNPKISVNKLEKIILPKKLRETYSNNGKLTELTQNTLLVEFQSKLIESEKMYKFKFLLEKTSKDQLIVRCIGEREALTIKQIKSIDHEVLVTKIVDVLNKLPDNLDQTKYVTISYHFDKTIDEATVTEENQETLT